MGPPAPETVLSSVEEISLVHVAVGASDVGGASEASAGLVAVTWWTGLTSAHVPRMAEPSVSAGAMTKAVRYLRVRPGTRMRS